MPTCSSCGKDNREGSRFCQYCGTPMAVPDSPQNLTVQLVDDVVHLEWDPPLWSEGRVDVIGYQVHRGTDPEWLYDTFDVGLNTSFVDEDVEEGVTYYYAIGALSSLLEVDLERVLKARATRRAASPRSA